MLTTGLRPYLLLTLLCALLFLPGLSAIPPTDRDEARFMQATKQMLETGDWVQIKFQQEPRNKKPVGIYWLQAATVRMLGQDLTVHWPYRLPSVIAAWLAVLATFACGRKLFNPTAGLIAGAALASSFIVVVEAHIAKTDAALLAATTLALTMLAHIYVLAREGSAAPLSTALLFWTGVGLGILIKGPLILLVAGTTVAALCITDRNARWLQDLRAWLGLPLVLLIVLPWVIAISGSAQNSFISDAVTQDLLPKLIGGQESHGAPPGTYLSASLLTAWPWSVLAPFAVFAAWRNRAQPAVRFCLAWLIPAWIVFEIVPTKLPHYTMPLYPALALLTAWALTDRAIANTVAVWLRCIPGKIYRIFWAAITVVIGVSVFVAHRLYGDASMGAGVAVAVMLIAAIAFVLPRFDAMPTAMKLTALGGAFSLTLTWGVLPHLSAFALSPRLAEIVSAQNSTAPVALVGYHEPSAVFLIGTKTLLTDLPGAAAHILAIPGALAAVPANSLGTVQTAVKSAGRNLSQHGEIDGYNYSRGDWVKLAIISATAKEQQP
jgi:4-amino-4-deoxy-L-arabinose transferase-like glycosyltransferase